MKFVLRTHFDLTATNTAESDCLSKQRKMFGQFWWNYANVLVVNSVANHMDIHLATFLRNAVHIVDSFTDGVMEFLGRLKINTSTDQLEQAICCMKIPAICVFYSKIVLPSLVVIYNSPFQISMFSAASKAVGVLRYFTNGAGLIWRCCDRN